MKKLTAFAIGIILVAGVISTAKADTIYFDDGTVYELQPGESVYVSSERVWEFTRFEALDLRIQVLEPLSTAEDDVDCLGFGYGGCPSPSAAPSESNMADLIGVMAENITN